MASSREKEFEKLLLKLHDELDNYLSYRLSLEKRRERDENYRVSQA